MQVLGTIAFILYVATPGAADPFNPQAYLDQKPVEEKPILPGGLTEHAVYRLNGARFHKLTNPDGSVFLAGNGELPDLVTDAAICPQHLPLLQEVMPLRQGLGVTPELKKLEPRVLPLIKKCLDGAVRSPVLTILKPDGAVVEIRAKKDTPPPPSEMKKDERDDAFDEPNP